MWILVIVVIVIGCIVLAVNSRGESAENIEVQQNPENLSDFELRCQNIADQILRDAHSGCAIGGCCVHDLTDAGDDSDEWDDENDDDDEVCYCEYYGEYVKRHSPCEHFVDRNPR